MFFKKKESIDDIYFNLKFTSKQFERQAKKSEKEIKKEKEKVKKALENGNMEAGRIHASNAIRLQNEANNFLRLASRIDACASKVKQAELMNTVIKSMGTVVKGMDKALQSMDPTKIGEIMDKFEQQFENLDVTTNFMESSMNTVTATNTPEDDVNALMAEVMDENNMDVEHTLSLAKAGKDTLSDIHSESLRKEVEKHQQRKKVLQ
ncbi:hypothetical protein ABK040_005800 [Willaertia magna]